MSLVSKRSPARERIYLALLNAPDALWTVRSLWGAVDSDQVSVDAVRPNLYLLLQARLVEEVGGQQKWTVRLTKAGVDRLAEFVKSWQSGGTATQSAGAS